MNHILNLQTNYNMERYKLQLHLISFSIQYTVLSHPQKWRMKLITFWFWSVVTFPILHFWNREKKSSYSRPVGCQGPTFELYFISFVPKLESWTKCSKLGQDIIMSRGAISVQTAAECRLSWFKSSWLGATASFHKTAVFESKTSNMNKSLTASSLI